jgi:hypothetical protein
MFLGALRKESVEIRPASCVLFGSVIAGDEERGELLRVCSVKVEEGK